MATIEVDERVRPQPCRKRSTTWLALAGFLLGAGCTGAIGGGASVGREDGTDPGPGGAGSGGGGADPGGSTPMDLMQPRPGEPAEQTFACNADAVPVEPPLRRLTEAQYRNTVHDLLAFGLGDTPSADTILASLAAALSGFPPSQRPKIAVDEHGTYRRMDQVVPQALVDSAYGVAVAIGNTLSRSPYLGKALGSCATDADTANDAGCVADFIRRFGARARRRPLTPDEGTFFQGIYGSPARLDAAALTDVVTVMLSAPQFLYLVEHGAADVAGKAGVATLSAFELAARLSYHFWNTMPDATLWAAAESGALLDGATLRQQVARLLDDPRGRAAGADFFREWLKLEDMPALDFRKNDARFRTFAGVNLPSAQLRQAVIDDAMDMVSHYAFENPTSVDDLLGSDRSFARGSELAALYGVAPWTGSGDPPQLPPDQRPGLFTRAWFLATGSVSSRPIMRGVFVRKHVLCDEIPPPPAAAAATPLDLSPTATTRQVVVNITEGVGGACPGCHATLINPIGFAFEGFDALGRTRTEERLFSATGQAIGSAPIDSTSVPAIVEGDATPSAGASDLIRLVRASGKPQRCLAQNYSRYAFGRWEDLSLDGCALEQLRRTAKDGSLRDLLAEVAFTPTFQQRSFR